MLVDLGLGAVKSIVNDGVKEMLSKVAESGQGCKNRGFFRAVKEVIKEYQRTMEEDCTCSRVQWRYSCQVQRRRNE